MKPETVDEIFRRCNCWILRADIRRVLEAFAATPEYQEMVKDAERIDKMQGVFVKGQETHILMCEGHATDECDHPEHPHFEAFDWNWRCPPVRGLTLREVMDAAIDAARNG